MSEADKLREKLTSIDADILCIGKRLHEVEIECQDLRQSHLKLCEAKSDCMKKIAEAVSLEKMRNGEL